MPTAPKPLRIGPAATAEGRRQNSHQRGYTREWYRKTQAYRNEHPCCEQCEKEGVVTAATVIDHKIPHRGNQSLFWNEDNWQALCVSCHSKKTAAGL